MSIKLEYPRVCKVPQQRLKKCLESKWDVTVNKLKKLKSQEIFVGEHRRICHYCQFLEP